MMATTVVLILIIIIFLYVSISTPIPPLIPNIQLSSLIGVGSSNNGNEESTSSSFISTITENPRRIIKSKKYSLWSNKTIDGLKRKIGSIRTKIQSNKNIKDDEPFSGDDRSDRRRRMRRFKFWSRAIRIYGSYKVFQAKKKVLSILSKGVHTIVKRNSHENITTTDEDDWNRVHEINSDRMLQLCLSLRGFYLKSGQFLATRQDFMPLQYIKKLRVLHDSVPPLSADEVRRILLKEMGAPLESFFSELDLEEPIGSASIAQVHRAVWKSTGEKVAVKVQNPHAERLMTGDLKSLVLLARFLQKTELKFDLLSALLELQKQIKNEFDFVREARNMDSAHRQLSKLAPGLCVPQSLFSSKRALVMTYVEGINLGKLKEFRSATKTMPTWMKKIAGKKILEALAQAWGAQFFEMRMFHADPHPGNICFDVTGANGKGKGAVGLLDWGQVKFVSSKLALDFSHMIEAINSEDQDAICQALQRLGIETSGPGDKKTVADIAVTMLDTRVVPGYVLNPFDPNHSLKKNAVSKLPPDLYFLVRTVQLLKGISYAFGLDFSLTKEWAPLARKTIQLETP